MSTEESLSLILIQWNTRLDMRE